MDDPLRRRPIGIFDSGIGGLTVVKELIQVIPHEDMVYFGDTARLPYGSKSDRLIMRYSIENSIFLNSKTVKMIVIACNTASAVSCNYLRNFIKLPVIGVIECGALGALRVTKNKRVGLIGTRSTINSSAYVKAIKNLDPEIEIFGHPTPLLVHLVEENWIQKKITIEILEEYLKPLLENNIDTLILGCTHYPLLKEQIRAVIGDNISLVDSSREVALLVLNILKTQNMLSPKEECGTLDIFLSDMHPEYLKLAKKVLGQEISFTLLEPGDNGL